MPAGPRVARAPSPAVRFVTAVAVAVLTATPLQAQQWYAQLSGAAEAVPTPSPGFGLFTFTLNGDILRIEGSFGGLLANTMAAHIHCCTTSGGTGTAPVVSAVPSFPGFPLGVTGGAFEYEMNLLSPTSYNPTFFNGVSVLGNAATARGLLLSAFDDGTAYFNVHTTLYPAGEIRGFITTVPEPSTYALMAAGLIAMGIPLRRRRARSGPAAPTR